jgi:lipopolysaccharide transport system ATP-binding protein
MSNAVTVDGLGKQYTLGSGVQGRLTESLASFLRSPIRRGRVKPQTIWALRDVSFEVAEGEVVGFIGHNGAGKSTLLKILSRITKPTEGRAQIRGRAGSLLEVGSGFHPDLTGAENLYLYGAILGMRRREVQRKFDEVVAFAEIEEFIDTPVKRYSSGMYMRLAFAVAAHLEPEVLIVDEVLAVGDLAFQRKCLGKMEDVAGSGRTVLFVSHNMAAIRSLCTRALLLESGRVTREGTPADVARHYAESSEARYAAPLDEREGRAGDGGIRTVALRVADDTGSPVVTCGSRLALELDYRATSAPLRSARFVLNILDSERGCIFRFDSDAEPGLPAELPAEGTIRCVTDPIDLTPGLCRVNVSLLKGGVLADAVDGAATFEVVADDYYRSGQIPRRQSVLALRHHRWSLR